MTEGNLDKQRDEGSKYKDIIMEKDALTKENDELKKVNDKIKNELETMIKDMYLLEDELKKTRSLELERD